MSRALSLSTLWSSGLRCYTVTGPTGFTVIYSLLCSHTVKIVIVVSFVHDSINHDSRKTLVHSPRLPILICKEVTKFLRCCTVLSHIELFRVVLHFDTTSPLGVLQLSQEINMPDLLWFLKIKGNMVY